MLSKFMRKRTNQNQWYKCPSSVSILLLTFACFCRQIQQFVPTGFQLPEQNSARPWHTSALYSHKKKQHRTGTERKVWSKGQPQPMFSLPVDLYMYVYRESMHAHWNCLHVSFTVALPIKCLHTILLGPYKYMVGDIVGKLTPRQ